MKASSHNLFVSQGDAACAAGSGPLSAELAARILAPDDWNFISSQTSPSIQQMFRRERKTISVSWLRQMRSQVSHLMKFHRQFAHPKLYLNLATELKLRGQAWGFYVVYGAAHLIIRISGPARAAGLMSRLVATVRRLWSLCEARVAETGSAHPGRTSVECVSPQTARPGRWSPARHSKDLVRNVEVEAAIGEIKKRDLVGLRSAFSSLTYLASTRDYNTARYYHEGLARRFTEEVMEQALAACHMEAFRRLVCCSIEETVRQLDIYVRAAPEPPVNVLHAWTRLEPFRVLMPMDCDQLSADFFVSNVRVVLGILQNHAQVAEPVFPVADLLIKP